jgi:ubiquitin-conjugating enzyme E2 M
MTFASERIRKDLESLLPSLPKWIKLMKREDLLLEFQYELTCGPYFKEMAVLVIRFPLDFPFSSPKLELQGSIREEHPFVDPKTGAVCMDILRLGWLPSIGLDTLVFGMGLLLEDPLSLYDKESVVLNESALLKLLKV